jgi:hypothetical protein
MDDLSPDDYTIQCPECLGSGLVEHDLEVDDMTPRPRQAALAERPYRQAALALMSHPPLPEEPKPFGHRQWINPAPISMRKRG